MRMRSFHKSAHHEAICSLGPGPVDNDKCIILAYLYDVCM